MAVVAFLNGGDLFGVNNANAVLAHNIGTFGTRLQLANNRTIPLTPTAGTMKGCMIVVDWGGNSTATTVNVKLQENIAGTWTDVAGTSVTHTASQITRTQIDNIPAGQGQGQFDIWTNFPTPKAITAVANTWRISVTSAAGNPFLFTSDGTNLTFVAVGTGTTTFVTNQDQPIITNSLGVYYTSSVRFLGILPTGVTATGVCGFVGSAATGNFATSDMLYSQTNGITTTLNGYFLKAAYAGITYGTEATPLTNHVINFDTSTVGSDARATGFIPLFGVANMNIAQKGHTKMFGTTPAVRSTYLTANAPVGATSVEVEHTTGWSDGDKIAIGGITNKGTWDTNDYTITSVSGKTINFTPALANVGQRHAGITGTLTIASPCVATWSNTNGHGLFVGDELKFRTTGALPTGITAGQKYYVISTPTPTTFTFSSTLGGAAINTSGTQNGTHTICVDKYAGRVFKRNANGITVQTNIAGGVFWYQGLASNLKIRGVNQRDVALRTEQGQERDYLAWQEPFLYENNVGEFTNTPVVSGPQMLSFFSTNQKGASGIKGNYGYRAAVIGVAYHTAGNDPQFDCEDNINIMTGFASHNGWNVGATSTVFNFKRNHLETYNVQSTWAIAASTWGNNRFWGCSSSIGANRFNSTLNNSFYRDIYDNCANGYYPVSTCVGDKLDECIFGPSITNASDISFLQGYAEVLIQNSPTTVVQIAAASNQIISCVIGSNYRVTNYYKTFNDNRTFSKYGDTQSCGNGLADTTVRTAGGYSIRLTPNNATNVLTFPISIRERTVPTGNIQNKTMTVSVWVNIANAAYAAGTHTKPTLKVKYDNSTIASTVATATYGTWQNLAVVFTPLTTFGQIEWWIEGATSATGTNRDFYVDDVAINYPAGVNLALGGLDLWANAYPVLPPIATNPALGGVWDEPTAAHGISGSYGERVNKIKAETGLIPALL